MNTLDLLQPLGWLLLLIGALIAAWAALVWHARRLDAKEAREGSPSWEEPTDYDWIDTAPAKLSAARTGGGLAEPEPEPEKTKRSRLIAEAQWHGPWGL